MFMKFLRLYHGNLSTINKKVMTVYNELKGDIDAEKFKLLKELVEMYNDAVVKKRIPFWSKVLNYIESAHF